MFYGDGPYSSQPYATSNPATYSLTVVEAAAVADTNQSPLWVEISTVQDPVWTDIPTN
jgi:hypothetical protein